MSTQTQLELDLGAAGDRAGANDDLLREIINQTKTVGGTYEGRRGPHVSTGTVADLLGGLGGRIPEEARHDFFLAACMGVRGKVSETDSFMAAFSAQLAGSAAIRACATGDVVTDVDLACRVSDAAFTTFEAEVLRLAQEAAGRNNDLNSLTAKEIYALALKNENRSCDLTEGVKKGVRAGWRARQLHNITSQLEGLGFGKERDDSEGHSGRVEFSQNVRRKLLAMMRQRNREFAGFLEMIGRGQTLLEGMLATAETADVDGLRAYEGAAFIDRAEPDTFAGFADFGSALSAAVAEGYDGVHLEGQVPQGLGPIVIGLDISASMATRQRIQAAIALSALIALQTAKDGRELHVLTFNSRVQEELTVTNAEGFIDLLSVVPNGGTNFGGTMQSALDFIGARGGKADFLLISDGQGGCTDTACQAFKDQGTKTIFLGVGSEPDRDEVKHFDIRRSCANFFTIATVDGEEVTTLSEDVKNVLGDLFIPNDEDEDGDNDPFPGF